MESTTCQYAGVLCHSHGKQRQTSNRTDAPDKRYNDIDNVLLDSDLELRLSGGSHLVRPGTLPTHILQEADGLEKLIDIRHAQILCSLQC